MEHFTLVRFIHVYTNIMTLILMTNDHTVRVVENIRRPLESQSQQPHESIMRHNDVLYNYQIVATSNMLYISYYIYIYTHICDIIYA